MEHSDRHAPRIGALDGLRGLAVAGVLAYHCGFGWARGGFLGVSLFFTLSGFLITSLLLAEHDRTGTIGLRAFWSRRARRLLPASLVTLAGIVAFGATIATGSQLRALRGDVLGALAYVANWRFVAAGTSYSDLWSSPSPVQHFWSLAIEEQLYLVLPLVIVGALAVGRGRRRSVAVGVGVLLAASLASTFLVHDTLRAYYGTDVRAAELLVGALLAIAPRLKVPSWAGGLALGALLVAWSTTTQPDHRLYHGGLLVHAVLVAVVISAARNGGRLASALSIAPLRWLGRISYAAYLYHWPLFLWLDRSSTLVRLTVTLVLATASTVLVEEPIRSGRRLTPAAARAALVVGVAATALASVLVTTSVPKADVAIDPHARARLIAPPTVLAASHPTALEPVQTAAPIHLQPGEHLRVYVAGDSNAFILGHYLQEWGKSRGIDVWASGWFGCEVVPGGEISYAGKLIQTGKKCNSWPHDRAEEIAAVHPHIAIVFHGAFDVLDRKLPGSKVWQHVGMPAYDALVQQRVAEMVDLFLYGGAHVLWAAYPHVRTGIVEGKPPKTDFPESAPWRMDRFNTIARQVVAARPGARMLELERFMQAWPKGELDPAYRLDGIHPNPAECPIVASWIGDQLLSLVER